jgi:predicted dehydrogenase
MTCPIRVGMIGIGNWAKHGHLPALNLLPEYRLSAIYSKRRDAAETAAAEYGFTYVAGTLYELVNHPEVDLVVVLTTAPRHAEGIRAAIGARKDVYSEWPLTPSTGLSAELAGFADTAGIRAMVGLHRRLAPHNRYLVDLLKRGYVGKLRSIRMHVSMNLFQPLLPKALSWTAPPLGEEPGDDVGVLVGAVPCGVVDARQLCEVDVVPGGLQGGVHVAGFLH